MQIDDTIRGFWQELEVDTSALDVWRIYCDYLQEVEHDQAETTRLWVEDRYSKISTESQQRLRANLKQGLRPLLPRRTNSIGTELVLVPKGTFWMSEDDENAQKQAVIARDFYMAIYPVTQGEWEAVMGDNPSFFSRSGGGAGDVKDISDEGLLRFPVEKVSWDEVQEFLKRLNKREEKSGLLFRLPIGSEWEYGCRSGLTSKQDCSFDFYLSEPTNDLSSDQANFHGNYPAGQATKSKYLERPTVVGSYEPNGLSIYDMHGNMCEWCQDWYEEGSFRVVRGGSWGDYGQSCRAANRLWSGPSRRVNFLGFRLACSPIGESSQASS